MLPRPIEVMCGQDDLRIPLTDVPFPRPKYERSLAPTELMRNRDLVSDSFLTLTAISLMVLCSSLLAFAFT